MYVFGQKYSANSIVKVRFKGVDISWTCFPGVLSLLPFINGLAPL